MVSRKIGIHLFGNPAVPLGNPAVVKTVDPSLADYWSIRSKVGPKCLIVIRFYYQDQNLDRPEERANQVFNDHRAFIMGVPSYEYTAYEGFNEIGEAQSEAHSLFEIERMRLLHNSGRRAVVGNWSVGVPHERSWYKYEGMLRAMSPGDFVGLHEYWSDNADIDNRYHVARFALPEVAPYLSGKKLVITEAGRDYMSDTKAGAPGWRLTTDENGFYADLEKVGALYDTFGNVLGATIYQEGSLDHRWDAFKVGSLWPRVVASYPAAPVEGPVFQPVEPPELLQPLERYVRISQGWKPPDHYGIDYSCYLRSVVLAPVAGVARCLTDTAADGGFGKYIRIETGHYRVYLAHLDQWAVTDRTRVVAGQPVAFSGNSGNSTGPHLHLEIRSNAGSPYLHGAIDPTPLLKHAAPPMHLPSNDTLTLAATTPKEIVQKCRWWLEEEERRRKAGDAAHADAIHKDLVALVYRAERAL